MRRLFFFLSIVISFVWTTNYKTEGFIRGAVSTGSISAIREFVGHLSCLGFFHSDSGPSDIQRISPDISLNGFSYKISQPQNHGDLHRSVYIQVADGEQMVHHFTLRVQYEPSEWGSAKYEIADIWFEVNKSECLQVCLSHDSDEKDKKG